MRKFAPFLHYALLALLAMGLGLASCNQNPVYAQQPPAAQADLRARLTADLLDARISGDLAKEDFAEALLAAMPSESPARYRRDGAAALNDLTATPGLADPDLTEAKLCNPKFHTATARDVTESQKKRICREYGIAEGCPGAGYEIDHLISIELGGSNLDANLWPQPADAPGVIGFHTKDVVENRTHKAVCEGALTLREAQKAIRTDWYRLGKANGFIP